MSVSQNINQLYKSLNKLSQTGIYDVEKNTCTLDQQTKQ